MSPIQHADATTKPARTCYTAPGGRGELRGAIVEHDGRQFANVCVWRRGRSGDFYPSRNALTVPVSDLPQLDAAVDALSEAATPNTEPE